MVTLLLIIIYIAFISLGLPDAMLGSAWPLISKDLGVSLSSAGLISMTVSIGTIISSLLSGKLIDKLGTGKVTAISVAMTAIALLGFSFSKGYLWLILMAIPLGLGAGSVDTALNNFVALHYSARHMSWLHCFWGVGATTGPIIMGKSIAKSGLWKNGYLTVAIIQIVLVIILFISLPLWKVFNKNSTSENEVGEVSEENKKKNIFKLPGLKTILLGFLCYCALESTAGLWGASYLVNVKGISPEKAASWISMYYLGITTGKFINGFITAKFTNRQLIRIGQGIIGLGALTLVLFDQSYMNLIGLILVGIGCAPIFPSIIHETPNSFGKENSSRIIGLQMAFAYIGTTLVPPSLGVIMQAIGVNLYPIFILLILVVMILSLEITNKVVDSNKKALKEYKEKGALI